MGLGNPSCTQWPPYSVVLVYVLWLFDNM
jgi:hypothetical protein